RSRIVTAVGCDVWYAEQMIKIHLRLRIMFADHILDIACMHRLLNTEMFFVSFSLLIHIVDTVIDNCLDYFRGIQSYRGFALPVSLILWFLIWVSLDIAVPLLWLEDKNIDEKC
ncbi:hypothetical protein ACJX0J_036642, partial [Zea mays]